MFWNVIREDGPESIDKSRVAGRYVLHRHRDAYGDHLDLRLEWGGMLLGWRIDGTVIDEEPWATEKAPHSTRWLDESVAAQIELAGRYAWERVAPDERVVVLETDEGCIGLRLERQTALQAATARALCRRVASTGLDLEEAAALIADGATARARAIERLCGLGLELDGMTFDAGLWRKTLAGLSLDEIHTQLRAFEARFDEKFPPRPISQPEPLEDDGEARSESALAIVRG